MKQQQHACMASRRQFLRTSAAIPFVTVAAVMVACEKQEGTLTGTGTVITVDISAHPELSAPGSIILTNIAGLNNGDPVFISRPTSTQFNVFTAICTHQGNPVDPPDATSANLVCPYHLAEFSKTNGNVLKQPTSGSASNLHSFATSYDASKNILSITP